MAPQETPDILHVNIAQRTGQQGPGPAGEPFRGRFVQQPQNPVVGGLRIDRLLARPRLVLQPFKSMVGIAMPPPPTELSAPASNRAAMSRVNSNKPQAPCDLSSKGGLLLLRVSSRC